MPKKNKKSERFFNRFSASLTEIAGRPVAFISALVLILLWIASGPFLHFSNTWQLIINTVTTLVTFLMVFVIQQSQNKDSMAMQLKLNELIAANKHCSNRLIDIEDLTEDELKILKDFYIKLSEREKGEKNLKQTHSIEEEDNEKLKEAEPEDKEQKKKS